MTEPRPDESGREASAAAADRTLRVARPPVPGRAVRAQMAAGDLAAPPFRDEDPTVTLDRPRPASPHRTLEFGRPAPVRVTVGPRPRVRRPHRTWPWILAVAFALVVLGVVLVVMQLQGQTIEGDVDWIGWSGPPPDRSPGASG